MELKGSVFQWPADRPWLSRLIGHPIYNWIAANRGKLSSVLIRSR